MYEADVMTFIAIILVLYAVVVLLHKLNNWAGPVNYGSYPNSPITHDFTHKEYTYSKVDNVDIKDGGFILIQSTRMVHPKDFIILDNGTSDTRYGVIAKSTTGLPTDLLQAKIMFAPRFLQNDKPIQPSSNVEQI